MWENATMGRRETRASPRHPHLLQNLVQRLGVDELVHRQPRLLFALVRQLQSVRPDETLLKFPNLWRKFRGFMGSNVETDGTLQPSNLEEKKHCL